jgi:hypothetical protein
MVAPEPGEPLLLYITATSEAVSMVLFAERPDPHSTHEFEGSLADGSGSQDPRTVEEPRAVTAAGSQSLEAATGLHDQTVVRPRPSKASPDTKDWEPPRPAPMEIEAPDPPGGSGPSSVRCTTSARSSIRQRPGTWRSTSCYMKSSSPSGSFVTTFKLTRSRWCLRIH